MLRTAGFHGPKRLDLDTAQEVTRTADEIVAAVFSLSSSAPHLFDPAQGQFERDLRALLHEIAPDGVFAERTRTIALGLWSP